jgi:hypothetical protein
MLALLPPLPRVGGGPALPRKTRSHQSSAQGSVQRCSVGATGARLGPAAVGGVLPGFPFRGAGKSPGFFYTQGALSDRAAL